MHKQLQQQQLLFSLEVSKIVHVMFEFSLWLSWDIFPILVCSIWLNCYSWIGGGEKHFVPMTTCVYFVQFRRNMNCGCDVKAFLNWRTYFVYYQRTTKSLGAPNLPRFLVILNSSVNFMIYCLMGTEFKKRLWETLGICCK